MKKIFVVGAPRSGTTLLQQLLVANFSIVSLPETHFFAKVYTENKLKSLLLSSKTRAYLEFLRIEKIVGSPNIFEKRLLSQLTPSNVLALGLTKFAKASGDYQGWLEKTPLHLHHLPKIEEIDDVKVIHIIRKGEAVAASLFKATNEYPKQWVNKRFTTFKGFSAEYCVERWNRDIRISQQYSDSKLHCIVFYEDILNNKTLLLEKISAFLQMERKVEENLDVVASSLINSNEIWKSNNFKNEIKQMRTKGSNRFSLEQQVLEMLNNSCYEQLYSEHGIK